MKKGETFKEKVLASDKRAESPSIRNGFNFDLQAKSSTDLLRQFKKVKREKVHNMQERLLESKLKESKGGCHQRQCQKKPPLPKTSTQVESQRVQGDQSQYNKVDTTKKPNQNVAEVQQSNEAPHVPKKLKRKPMCPHYQWMTFLSQLKDHLTQNPEQNHTEAFKEVFGKEKASRVRYYGRNVTPTALKQKEKQNQIMDSMKQEHAKEVNSLKSELQDVKQQMLGMQSFIKVWMQQNNSGMDMENLDVFFRSFPSEANNAQNGEGQCNEHSTTHASNPD
ncbi:uncharacterized protein G2W53_007796 [Senna tora]|uniref:Uncharacterized protein n=1 Tax=Senna tora TaxID=362788 RepID=A0A834X7Z4_9FABA|nr:uncharacterized protein G2W53_007796 [Senna tora]